MYIKNLAGRLVIIAALVGATAAMASSGAGVEIFVDGVSRSSAVTDSTAKTIRERLAERWPDIVVKRIAPAALPDFYRLYTDRGVLYLHKSAPYLFAGELFDLRSGSNVTELARTIERSRQRIATALAATSGPPARVESAHEAITQPTATPERKAGTTANATAANQTPTRQHNEADIIGAKAKQDIEQYKRMLIERVRKQAGLSPTQDAKLPSPEVKTGAASPDSAGGGANETQMPNMRAIPKVGFNADGAPMTEAAKRAQISALYKKIPRSWTVNYPAIGKQRAEMLVFSDYTCPYCQRLHNDMRRLNEAGITVRYLMFPRVLAYGKSDQRAKQAIEQFSNAWCARDQRLAFDELYATGIAPQTSCDDLPKRIKRTDPPVEEHFQLGKLFNVAGTPYIVLPDGRTITGYRGFEYVTSQVLR